MEEKNMTLSDDMLDQVTGGVNVPTAGLHRGMKAGSDVAANAVASAQGDSQQVSAVVRQALNNGGVISAGEGSMA